MDDRYTKPHGRRAALRRIGYRLLAVLGFIWALILYAIAQYSIQEAERRHDADP